MNDDALTEVEYYVLATIVSRVEEFLAGSPRMETRIAREQDKVRLISMAPAILREIKSLRRKVEALKEVPWRERQ